MSLFLIFDCWPNFFFITFSQHVCFPEYPPALLLLLRSLYDSWICSQSRSRSLWTEKPIGGLWFYLKRNRTELKYRWFLLNACSISFYFTWYEDQSADAGSRQPRTVWELVLSLIQTIWRDVSIGMMLGSVTVPSCHTLFIIFIGTGLYLIWYILRIWPNVLRAAAGPELSRELSETELNL